MKSLNQNINTNKIKHLLVENEFKKLKIFNSIYFRGKRHFEEDGSQNYLVFQPIYQYFKRVSGVGSGNYIYFWKSKELSDENITAPNTSDYSLNPQLRYLGNKTRVIILGTKNNNSNYSTLKKCLFGAVSFTTNADINMYNYFGCGIGFDGHGSYSHPSGGNGKKIIFGVDVSSSTKSDNRKKDILILGLGTIQGLEHTLGAEKIYSINFYRK